MFARPEEFSIIRRGFRSDEARSSTQLLVWGWKDLLGDTKAMHRVTHLTLGSCTDRHSKVSATSKDPQRLKAASFPGLNGVDLQIT